jgi:NitT/TauT family transport system ATP-binding protein
VFRPELYDAALGQDAGKTQPGGPFRAFAGPAFDPADIKGYLDWFAVSRPTS